VCFLLGVLFTFGLAILIKNGLNIIAIISTSTDLCENKAVYSAVHAVQAIFIVVQVAFLFQYNKVFIQDYKVVSR